MQHLPRHLLLAAVVLTVCCAERGGWPGATPDKRPASAVTGETVTVSVRSASRRKQQVRPAAVAPLQPSTIWRAFAADFAVADRGVHAGVRLDAAQMPTPPPAG
jgi:hypothetical protein